MADRKPIVSANWKMNLNHFEAIQLVQKLAFGIRGDALTATDVVLHAPFTDLRSVQTLLEGDRIPMLLGAQHCYFEPAGAFTGEISPTMLAKLNVKYVLAGHSERRQLFGETNETVNKRVQAIISVGMSPILCIGDTAEERDGGNAEQVVLEQLDAGFRGVALEAVATSVVAYEPVWAIGTGRTATPGDAQAMCSAIRSRVADQWGDDTAQSLRIQYGGSVKPVNTPELIAEPDIDGLLVGGASLDGDEFARVVAAVGAYAVLA